MVRPYREPYRDALWALKRGFETALGSGTGGEEKATRYEAKLDDDYRTGYLQWVERCVAEEKRAVQVAEDGGCGGDAAGALAGYVFVLPESLTYVWDAAVINEIFVREPYRGTDVADDLMGAALAVARGQDTPLERVVLDVDPANERARAFYDRWGFEPWGEMVARKY